MIENSNRLYLMFNFILKQLKSSELLLAILLIVFSLSCYGFQPSFSCDSKLTEIEDIICGSDTLSRLDAGVSILYKKIRASGKYEVENLVKSVQKKWLRFRNKLSEDVFDLEFKIKISYQQQKNRLRYILNNIEVIENDIEKARDQLNLLIAEDYKLLEKNPAKLEKLYLLLEQENLPDPDEFFVVDENKYLVTITNIARLGQGLYAVNLNNNTVTKILGGLPNTVIPATPKNPLHIIKSVSLRKGVMNTSIAVVHKDNGGLGFEVSWIYSGIEDGVTGGCGRGMEIGINNSSKTIVRSVIDSQNRSVVELIIKRINCDTNEIEHLKKNFHITEHGVKELSR